MCPIRDCSANIGNCQFCDNKGDCIFLTILNKLEKLEAALEKQA